MSTYTLKGYKNGNFRTLDSARKKACEILKRPSYKNVEIYRDGKKIGWVNYGLGYTYYTHYQSTYDSDAYEINPKTGKIIPDTHERIRI